MSRRAECQDYLERRIETRSRWCDICRSTTVEIDDDPLTGAVRGLLCRGCRRGLREFGDSLEHLTAAAAYLRRTSYTG